MVPHPRDALNEPERRILYLADAGDKDLEDIGWTMSGATLAPMDNYFMRFGLARGPVTFENIPYYWPFRQT
ncbi:MAG: hypothetical protein ACP5DX_13270 [Paracoccaceae bacterium]